MNDRQVLDTESFVLRKRGRTYADFQVGQTFNHHWGRTLHESDNTMFCTATCNWNPLYLNYEFARANGHPDCPIHPSLVLCVVIGLSVEDLSETAGPFLGLSNCVFPRPVYPGETLTAESVVLACRVSDSRPDTGVVTWRTTGHDRHGDIIVSFVRSNLVAVA